MLAGPDLEIVVPVFDEEADLARSIRLLHSFLRTSFPFTFRITIADNASTDGTWDIARSLADGLPGVRAVHLDQKGRGHALHAVWSASDATVLAYMDVDLSTDLAALLPLVAPLLSGHSDLAIGSRLSRSARVVRGPKRELISRCYNRLLRTALSARFSDAQCGFKAIRADRARSLLPLVHDTGWFFDTELLVLAERAGLRIHEVPVDWVDDPDSRVDIVSTALADLRGVARLARGLATGSIPVAALREELHGPPVTSRAPGFVGQVVRFAAIGVASTVAYLALFLGLRTVLPALAANAVSLLVTAVANTAANRRWTFGVRGFDALGRHHTRGLLLFGAALAMTTGSLAALRAIDPSPARSVELAVLVAANLAATVVRFGLLRTWVFRAHRRAPEPAAAIAATEGSEA
ncbi:MAG TPA: bifunctional glycosyltransferase family 2/GtrA family protein [Actinomycetota bacterium]